MADENGATGTQADPETQPPVGTSPTQADGESEQTTQPETLSHEDARKLRSEANSLRRRLKDLEEAERKRADAELSETDRLTKRVAELEQEREKATRDARDQALRMATVSTAARLGFADPQDALALLPRESIELDGGGEPTNVQKLLSDLLRSKPYLASAHARPTGSADGGSRGGQGPSLDQQIAEATAKGDHMRVIALEMQKMGPRPT